MFSGKRKNSAAVLPKKREKVVVSRGRATNKSNCSRDYSQRSISAASMHKSFNQEVENSRINKLSAKKISDVKREKDSYKKDLLDARKNNADLKLEIERLRKKCQGRDDAILKYRDLK